MSNQHCSGKIYLSVGLKAPETNAQRLQAWGKIEMNDSALKVARESGNVGVLVTFQATFCHFGNPGAEAPGSVLAGIQPATGGKKTQISTDEHR